MWDIPLASLYPTLQLFSRGGENVSVTEILFAEKWGAFCVAQRDSHFLQYVPSDVRVLERVWLSLLQAGGWPTWPSCRNPSMVCNSMVAFGREKKTQNTKTTKQEDKDTWKIRTYNLQLLNISMMRQDYCCSTFLGNENIALLGKACGGKHSQHVTQYSWDVDDLIILTTSATPRCLIK